MGAIGLCRKRNIRSSCILTWVFTALPGGSWVALSDVISSVTIIVITHIRGLITLLITAHEPPSICENNPSRLSALVLLKTPTNNAVAKDESARTLMFHTVFLSDAADDDDADA